MSDLFSTFAGVVTFKRDIYESLLASRNVMRTGILILLLVFLMAALPQFIADFVDAVRPITAGDAAAAEESIREDLEPFLNMMETLLPEDARSTFRDQFLQNLEAGINMARDLEQVEAPLPRGVARFFTALGGWLSKPFFHLGLWLAYSIWVILFARLLGGQGGLDAFLGLTAFYALPNLLGMLGIIPSAGWLFAAVGTVWGWAVYVRAVQVSQRFDLGKALLTALLPALALLFIAILALLGLTLVILLAASS